MNFIQSFAKHCLIVLILFEYFCPIIVANDDGWCSELVSMRKTRTVWRQGHHSVEKKTWYGYRWTEWEPYNYRDTEAYDTYERRRKCCYMYSLLNGNCEPKCVPACRVNSYCERPYSCKCNEGYSADIDYEEGPIDCSPVCNKDCPAHSSCTEPNKCTCDDGYEGTTNCSPVCHKECGANSYCSEPDQCACNEGYALNETLGRECQPLCDDGCPTHSKCTAPNECTCDQGYDGHDCHPVCEESCAPNSFCASPEHCVCNEGYERDAADAPEAECQPVCSAGCPANSYCTQPNYCSCHDGFHMNNDTQSCQPVCSSGCPTDSSCSAPEVCLCNPGYVMSENGSQCEPVCFGGCPAHSLCASPSNCQCDDGYKKQKLTTAQDYCEPICEQDCSAYGKCVRPGACECFAGYEMNTDDQQQPLCRPHCSQGCVHGFCFGPEICVCDPGYLMGPNNSCAPVCSLGCVNGQCIEPEICSCSPGYKLQDKSVHVCEPVCEQGCEQADCIAPNVCICWNRYQPAENSSSICVPTCPKECLNGYCNASFECSCHEGYVPHSYAPNECLPSCKYCQNGECVEPEVCQCWPGYVASVTIVNDEKQVSCVLQTTLAFTTTTSDNLGDDTTMATTADATTIFDISRAFSSSLESTKEPILELVDFAQCQARCKCWTAFDEMGLISPAKCQKLCADDFNQPCLDLNQCRCSLEKLQLLCNSSSSHVGDSTEDEDLLYSCAIKQFPSTPVPQLATTEVSLSQGEAERNVSKANSKIIFWILAAIVCGTLILTLSMFAWRRVSKRPNTDIVVGFQDDDNDL